MTIDDYLGSLRGERPPAGLSTPLLGLWLDARGDWNGAHDALQDDDSDESAWVHAYLHRKEGDFANAGYWYRRAGQAMGSGTAEQEWRRIVAALLGEPEANTAGR